MTGLLSRRRFLTVTAGGLAMSPFASLLARESSGLIVHTQTPMNAEPPLPELVKNWHTPTEQFYIRSHAPVPKIDGGQFRLSVTGLVNKELSLSLDQLAKYDQQSVMATMTCAGNRRYEHSKVSPVKGVQWREGAIGNAEWTGVGLSELLKEAGVKENAKHVWFEGLDQIEHDGNVIPFGGSIPLAKAMDDTESMPGALVTTGMNGQPLASDHGWPLRTVVPGYIGARSVKWLGKVIISDRPSPNHYVATAYKVVTEDGDLDWAEQGPIYRYPINAAVCSPTAGSVQKPGEIAVSGYALPPGHSGRTIKRVDVSTDQGKTWTAAKLTSPAKEYCWQLWSARIRVTPDVTTLWTRAIDSAGERQPAKVAWNLKGYLFNAWHRMPIEVRS